MENVNAAMVEAAKEITVTILREDKHLLHHDAHTSPEKALDSDITRVSKLYEAVFGQIKASYKGRESAKEIASVN